MSGRAKDIRSRDDTNLRKAVSEIRERAEKAGIQERGLDWDAIAKEEQGLWWRNRVKQALDALASRSGEFAGSVGEWVVRLAKAPESLAAAAVDIALDSIQRIGHIEPIPAACVEGGAGLQFSYAPATVRSSLGVETADEHSVGLLISSTIPGARIMADVERHTVTIEFWSNPDPPLLLLIPEDPDQPTVVGQVHKPNYATRAVFENLTETRYLLAVYVAEPES